MTIKTPIAEVPDTSSGTAPQRLPDLGDLARLANEFFNGVPGADGFGRGPSVFGLDSAASAIRQASAGPTTATPISHAGAGLSPGAIDPEHGAQFRTPAETHFAAGQVGAGLLPGGVSGIGPGVVQTFPQIASPGHDLAFLPDLAVPDLGLPHARTASEGLYILEEARHRPAAPASPEPVGAHVQAPGHHTQGVSRGSLTAPYDVEAVRRAFPILAERINGRPLIWLDNGATTQKPRAVIDRLAHFYEHENSNVHRAAHTLAARATDAYENARKIVARFIGAASPEEIVFVRGTTEAINLVAGSWGRDHVKAGDEILVSHLEHHANIVPWQQLAAETSAHLKVIPVDDDGQVRLDEFERLLSEKTKIVAVTHVSNALGTIVPIKTIIDRAHAAGAKVLIDAAQSIAHERINLQFLGADFLAFSGHKIFAPTGIGVLYGKRALLDAMRPYQTGGNMIADVTFEKTQFQKAPARFEAGTGNLADAVGLGAALEFVEEIGLERISAWEHDLLRYAEAQLRTIPGLRLFGSASEKAGVLSFLIGDRPPEEIGRALDQYGIAVRSGHHCAQPILRRFGVEGTVRATLALYNTQGDVDCLVSALRQIASQRG